MKVTELKGGSLSSTCLHEDGDVKFIRKTISTTNNREYGYVRWYSQLKKLQRQLSTGVYPSILNVGYDDNLAYFDIEYMKGFVDIKTILTQDELNSNVIEKINDAMMLSFAKLHNKKFISNLGAPSLYFKEEVVQKLVDSLQTEEFSNFVKRETFEYNGTIVHGINSYLDELKNYFNELQLPTEEIIHGNPTLENMMYSFEEDRVVFIDPYEESIIDSKFLDYAQVLQCSRSCYGFYNDRPESISIDESSVYTKINVPINFIKFNEIFESRIAITSKTKRMIDIFEATQFIRMLPFKCLAGNLNQAKFFYVYACYLFGKLL